MKVQSILWRSSLFFASLKEYVVPSFAQAPWAQCVSTQQLQCGGTDANAAVVNDKV